MFLIFLLCQSHHNSCPIISPVFQTRRWENKPIAKKIFWFICCWKSEKNISSLNMLTNLFFMKQINAKHRTKWKDIYFQLQIFFPFPENHLSIILWVSLQKLKSWQIVESSIEKLSSRRHDKLWNPSIHQIDLWTATKQQTIRRWLIWFAIFALESRITHGPVDHELWILGSGSWLVEYGLWIMAGWHNLQKAAKRLWRIF